MTTVLPGDSISMGNLAATFGGTPPLKMSTYYRGAGLVAIAENNSFIPAAGTLRLSDFCNYLQYFSNKTVALFPFDTDLVDTKSGLTGTVVQGTGPTIAVSTTQYKYGTGCININAAGTNSGGTPTGFSVLNGPYLEISSPSFAFQKKDFTIEFWVNFTRHNFGYGARLISNEATGTPGAETYCLDVFPYGGASQQTLQFVHNIGILNSGSTTVLALNTWYHVAMCRATDLLTVYLNGKREFQLAGLANANFGNTSQKIKVGGTGTNNYNFNGYIDDLRIISGVARYTADFTPPTKAHALLP